MAKKPVSKKVSAKTGTKTGLRTGIKTNAKSNTKPTVQDKGNGIVSTSRLGVQKTYKMYVGGAFPRTESGRYYTLKSPEGKLIGNICQGSRKDFREAVVVARKAQNAWAGRTSYNRSQIIYRIAEMMEGRKAQFVEELVNLGLNEKDARKEVEAAIDRVVYYAGWADKYQQIFSSVNPVASSHFNFTQLEPMGVIAAFAPEESGLLGLVSIILPLITGGNTVIILASNSLPTVAITFAEVLNSSDVPGGVVNILTGNRGELLTHFTTHMDVNAMVYSGKNQEELKAVQLNATHNLKRVITNHAEDWFSENAQSPYSILDAQESKTTWHPVGI